ncbi:hypothetical protein BV25DRAFT_1824830 [Artomyces pyxidatus]|uniref:Uncharacterized protein n=1 Tax=Artomyces pyxidatus TaxID=48021 RepID=A0ACB8T3A8_9AGAM|nr:hypothetical protein BV25DRAFT_1824830 [Artomyces pyxidatus]
MSSSSSSVATPPTIPYDPVPLSPASEDRIVRFDDACILIPLPPSRSLLPKLLSKSYSLPLFKRKPQPDPPLSPVSLQHEERDASFSFPRRSKKSPSPSRGFRFDDEKTLHSCLVHHDTSAPHTPRLRARRPSLPLPEHPSLITVPLRPCCPDCFAITESALLEGDNWTEHFTRAARRRRSASVDNHHRQMRIHDMGKSDDVWPENVAPAEEGLSTFLTAIAIDEVAKAVMRKSVDVPLAGPQPSSSPEEITRLDGALSKSRKMSPYEDDDDDAEYMPAILAHRPPLSPIPSTNVSVDHLPIGGGAESPAFVSGAMTASPKTDSYITAYTSSSGPSSPLLTTPPQTYPDFGATHVHLSDSPPLKRSPFHIPSGASFLRVGADVLKGVSALSGPVSQ